MQTFLPYPDFRKSAKCLDYKRLGKQRVEARQILDCITTPNTWRNHPAVLMWEKHTSVLKLYYNHMVEEWIARGYNNTMDLYTVSYIYEYPRWFGDQRFHASHRSNLLRKNPEYYSQFQWTESNNLPYFWPTKEGY